MSTEPVEKLDLAGEWLICPDPDNVGVRERWFASPRTPSLSESSSEGSDPTTPTPTIPTGVPSDWHGVLGESYHGVAWYFRRVELPQEWLKSKRARFWLRFDSVATDCRVWVNGREVGRHVGDFLPFQFDVTAAAEGASAIDLAVRVDEIAATRPPPGETTENGHITKGFHDVLSLQHGGIWGGVSLRRTGPFAIVPNGVRVIADVSGAVTVRVELEPHQSRGRVTIEGDAPGYPWGAGESVAWFEPGQRVVEVECVRASGGEWTPELWSPDHPALGEIIAMVHEDRAFGVINDTAVVRFGFRSVTTGGPNNRNILLNGKPIRIRGVLHWGVEPRHVAPAPPPEQVRAEFARLKEMGFNCVCLCMVYMPEYYYDIADAMGMLIWQEHPTWKSRMEPELLPEYRRLLDGFFRRDRRHASVVIVSGSCEHERIHPELAAWWWKRAKEELPDRLVQVQTAFLSWVNPAQTDLHDEHVYESSGRWVKFLEDVQSAMGELPAKPFVMGETVIGTAWVDTGAYSEQRTAKSEDKAEEKVQSSKFKVQSGLDSGLRTQDSGPDTQHAARSPQHAPWWHPRGLTECRAFERWLVERYGAEGLERFRRHAARNNLLHRKFQSEVFRSYPNHAGWVMNQIRDVPAGRLGFMDELDRWRFTPDQTQPWLSDCPILLKTPDWRTGFSVAVAGGTGGTGGRSLACELGVANFGPVPYTGAIEVRIAGRAGEGVEAHERDILSPEIGCSPGDVKFVPIRLDLPAVDRPTPFNVRTVTPGLKPNGWDIWAFPEIGDVPDGVVRLDGLPFDARDRELDFEERAYSSGWGLKVRTWRPVLPFPETVLFRCPLWRFDAPMPPGTRVVVTHKMTAGLVDFLEHGGRVVWLAAGRSKGSLPTKFITLWGQCPLVAEEGPLGAGDSEWVVDLLHHDLTRRYTRAIPVEEIVGRVSRKAEEKVQSSKFKVQSGEGTGAMVDPIVRYVYTHDGGAPKFFDGAFMTRVGRGVLIATSLDHTEDAGRYLMDRFLRFLVREAADCRSAVEPGWLRGLAEQE